MTTDSNDRLTPAQLEIMDLLWTHDECEISFLWAQLKERRPIARNTVLTLVNRLVERGVLTRRHEGRSFVYRPRLRRHDAQKHGLRETLDNLFQGSAENLVRSLLGNRLIKPDEITRLKQVLADAEKKTKKKERKP